MSSIYDQDTDPSSPEARRPAREPVEASPLREPPRSARAATTDPGVGPPSAPTPEGKPMAVVVPPSSGRGSPVTATPAAHRPKDSVELLLEGMAGPRPDRTKTMPQTAGDAAAAYHAEHAVRAGRASKEEGDPKVLVETARVPVVADPERGDLRPGGDPTYVLPARLGPRIAIAVLAGLAVAATLFIALGRPTPRAPQAAAPAQPSAAVLAPPPAPIAVAPGVPSRAEPPPEAVEPPAAPLPASSGAPSPSVAARPRAGRPKSGTSDVGEFKTSF